MFSQESPTSRQIKKSNNETKQKIPKKRNFPNYPKFDYRRVCASVFARHQNIDTITMEIHRNFIDIPVILCKISDGDKTRFCNLAELPHSDRKKVKYEKRPEISEALTLKRAKDRLGLQSLTNLNELTPDQLKVVRMTRKEFRHFRIEAEGKSAINKTEADKEKTFSESIPEHRDTNETITRGASTISA